MYKINLANGSIRRNLPKQIARVLPVGSHALHLLLGVGECCRFEPTCSAYGQQAVERFGFMQGFWLTGRRLLRCGPGGGAGWDPVPEKGFKE